MFPDLLFQGFSFVHNLGETLAAKKHRRWHRMNKRETQRTQVGFGTGPQPQLILGSVEMSSQNQTSITDNFQYN